MQQPGSYGDDGEVSARQDDNQETSPHTQDEPSIPDHRY
jgi:hypothetical protein